MTSKFNIQSNLMRMRDALASKDLGLIELECNELLYILENKFAFSPAEDRVFALVVDGFTNRKIAEDLMVTEKTVKFHLSSIFKKTGVKNRAEMIVLYWKEKLASAQKDQKAS